MREMGFARIADLETIRQSRHGSAAHKLEKGLLRDGKISRTRSWLHHHIQGYLPMDQGPLDRSTQVHVGLWITPLHSRSQQLLGSTDGKHLKVGATSRYTGCQRQNLKFF